VSLGAVIGALVSVTILPSRREVVVASMTAKVVEEFPVLLRNAVGPQAGDDNSRDKFEFRMRQSLRELGLLIRDRPDALPTKGPAAAMVKFTVQMHADIAFLKRELQAQRALAGVPTSDASPAVDSKSGRAAAGDTSTHVLPELENFVLAFADTVTQVAAMARGRSGPPDVAALRECCGRAAQALHRNYAHSEGARLMLRRLVEDLAALIRSIEHAGQFRPRS
jgi:hypothetical protein